MIRLKPLPESQHHCPFDDTKLDVLDWYIPGMRNLADLRCPECHRAYYGDLLAGHGLSYPMLLEQESGQVHDHFGVGWFANWLKDSYAKRQDTPLEMTVESLRPLRRPLLLNCLDVLYGHSLLKLLNAQYYIDHALEYDLILLIPRFLRWLVPDGVAEIWTVDLPLREGTLWNDWLATELHKRLNNFQEVWLSVAFSHPHPKDFNIARFTQIEPFPIDEWETRLIRPVVTFIWREDRNWWDVTRYESWKGLPRRIKRRICRLDMEEIQIEEQNSLLIFMANSIRRAYPMLDFAVVGFGKQTTFPNWISDMRTSSISESIEKAWCARYSQSHLVIGVHGSNMLLPSAQAGTVIELVPDKRWHNLMQDILLSNGDCREMLFRYRFIPVTTSSRIVANIAVSLIKDLPQALLNFREPLNNRNELIN
jgi:hypothetical protein